MPSSELGETIKPIPTLGELLIKSTLSPTVSIPDGIKKIDLGTLGYEAKNLVDKSVSDPEGCERSKVIYITSDNKILLQTKDNVGTKGNVQHEVSVTTMEYEDKNPPKHLKQDRFYAGTMHTHGTEDLPPSPRDLSELFKSLDSIDVTPMVFVATPALKSIYFRGKNTPQWDDRLIEKFVTDMNYVIKYNVQKSLRPNMSDNEILGINAIETHKIIRLIRKKYNLRSYSCPIDSNIAIEESA